MFIAFLFCIFFTTGCANNSHASIEKKIETRKSKAELINISEEAIKSIGLMNESVSIKNVDFQVKYNGIVKAIPRKTFYVASPVKGRVLNIFVDQGETILNNQKLAEISSQDIAELELGIVEKQIDLERETEEARLELSLAENSYLREKKLFEDGITAKKDFLETETKYKRAENDFNIISRKKESVADLSKKRLSILGANSIDSKAGFIEIRAPQSGIVLKRLVNPGEIVSESSVLLQASDLSEVFLESNIYEKDLSEIKIGEKIAFYAEAFPGIVFNGDINYIAQTADPDTRTIPIRARIQNPEHNLKPEMFGKMLISLSNKKVLAISKKAVQKVDNKSVVYIKLEPGYREVEIKTGREAYGIVEVLSGLKSEQKVVTEGSFWLRSKLHNI